MSKIITKCGVQVYPNDRWGSFHGHQCRQEGVVERDGKTYCRQHDPERVAKKDKERQARWNAEWASKEKAHGRLQVMIQACEGVSTEVLEKIKIKDLWEVIELAITYIEDGASKTALQRLQQAISGKGDK